jgi:hypothetical protein
MRCCRHQPAPTIAKKEVIRPEWHRVERGDLVLPPHNIENHKNTAVLTISAATTLAFVHHWQNRFMALLTPIPNSEWILAGTRF